MIDTQKISRYCFLKAQHGFVAIKLQVDDELVAGAEFRLYDEKGDKFLDKWKIGAQGDDFIMKELKYNPTELNRRILTWQILTCSKDVNTDQGIVNIEFYQSKHQCKLTVPTRFRVENIPPCKIRRSRKFTQSLMFILKT